MSVLILQMKYIDFHPKTLWHIPQQKVAAILYAHPMYYKLAPMHHGSVILGKVRAKFIIACNNGMPFK